MGLGDDLLTILTDYSGGYKLMRRRTAGQNSKDSRIPKNQTLYTTLYRLKKRGFIENQGGIWHITKNGKNYLKSKLSINFKHHIKYLNRPKDMKYKILIIFDIPEKYRKMRDWLRIELISLGFNSVQKSVWLGPSPLPQGFIYFLKGTGLLRFIKFLKVKEEDLI